MMYLRFQWFQAVYGGINRVSSDGCKALCGSQRCIKGYAWLADLKLLHGCIIMGTAEFMELDFSLGDWRLEGLRVEGLGFRVQFKSFRVSVAHFMKRSAGFTVPYPDACSRNFSEK